MKHFGHTAQIPLMVAVSGGKDSLALWDVLHALGYQTTGVHIHLGIDRFSESSLEAVERFARERNLPWTHRSIKELIGYDLFELQRRTRRKMCALCGMLKRHLLNRLCAHEGFRAIALGHNLDDEAGRLLGNLVRHRQQYLSKQYPYLPSTHPRLPAKLKPLYRLQASEIRTYCTLRTISFLDDPCPLSRGATSHFFRSALDQLESKMPGTKRDFLFGYLQRNKPDWESEPFATCRICGEPAYSDTCGVCNLLASMSKQSPEGH